MRCAVIDIGTNSVKLLVANAASDSVDPVWEESTQTRLGKGFYQDHKLRADAIAQTAEAVGHFAKSAKARKATSIRVVATSAVRDASNREQLIDAIREVSGLTIEVISGEQEADWVYDGVRSDPGLGNQQLLILDLGGGSTEFILGDGAHHIFRQSFAIGTVRLMEYIQPSDPPEPQCWRECQEWVQTFLKVKVTPLLQPHLNKEGRTKPLLVGTGGTTSILAAMELGLTAFDRARIEGVQLSQTRVWEFQKMLWGMPLAKRQKIPGLPPNRADVILFGVAVFALVMDVFGFEQIRVSTRGLRFGALLDSARRG